MTTEPSENSRRMNTAKNSEPVYILNKYIKK